MKAGNTGSDVPATPPEMNRFREIDVRLAVLAVDLSRRLGLYVFLPLVIVTGIIVAATARLAFQELTEPHGASVNTLCFGLGTAVFVLSLVLFAQRRHPRPYVMIPSGCVAIAVGILLLIAWTMSIVHGDWGGNAWSILIGWIYWFGPVNFGIALCRYGYLLYRASH